MPSITIRNHAEGTTPQQFNPAAPKRILDRSTLPFDALRTVDFDLFKKSCTCTFVNGNTSAFSLDDADIVPLSEISTTAKAIDAMARLVFPKVKGEAMKAAFHGSLAALAKQNHEAIAQDPESLENLVKNKEASLKKIGAQILEMRASSPTLIHQYKQEIQALGLLVDPRRSVTVQDLDGFFLGLAASEQEFARLNTELYSGTVVGELAGFKDKVEAFEKRCKKLTSSEDVAELFNLIHAHSNQIIKLTSKLKQLEKGKDLAADDKKIQIQETKDLINWFRSAKETAAEKLRPLVPSPTFESEIDSLEVFHESLTETEKEGLKNTVRSGLKKAPLLDSYLDGYLTNLQAYEEKMVARDSAQRRKEEFLSGEQEIQGLHDVRFFKAYKDLALQSIKLGEDIASLNKAVSARQGKEVRTAFVQQLLSSPGALPKLPNAGSVE